MNRYEQKDYFNRDELKTYRLKITTISPVHIGTGEVYEPINYVIDGQKLYEFDEVLFYKSLSEAEKRSFSTKLNDYMQIIDFYKSKVEQAKEISYFECDVSKIVMEKYNKAYNKDGSKNKNKLEILRTFKDPNNQRAIIPGSSIKGMLETSLKIYSPKEKDNIPRQKLIISDALIASGGIEIGYAKRVHRDPKKQSKEGIEQLIEVVKPNSEFVFTIKTNKNFNEIQQYIDLYYSKRKPSKYKKIDNGFIARIGKNVGKDYMVDVENVLNIKNKDGKPLATHFLYYSDSLKDEQFGWVKVEIISNEEFKNYLETIAIKGEKQAKTLLLKQQNVKDVLREQAQKTELEKKIKQEEEQLKQKAINLAKEEEEKRLTNMSQWQRKMEELIKNDKANTPKHTLILKAYKEGFFDEHKSEVLEYVKTIMKEENKWKETSTSKKPEKDREYQLTLEVINLFKLLK